MSQLENVAAQAYLNINGMVGGKEITGTSKVSPPAGHYFCSILAVTATAVSSQENVNGAINPALSAIPAGITIHGKFSSITLTSGSAVGRLGEIVGDFMTTAQEVFNITMDLIDERLDSGIISASETKSYAVKTPGILSLLQSELIEQGDIFKTYEISNTPIQNLFGYKSEMDIREFKGSELVFECKGSAKAYYFEVDKSATVYIEDFNGAWNTLATINATSNDGYTAYKGVLTPSNGATKSRMRFGGTYYYRTINRALFDILFASSVDVSDYRPWVKKSMPTDFKSVHEIINEYPIQHYSKDALYKWEGRSDLYMNYYYNGIIRIVYRPTPSLVNDLTEILQVDDVTARTILPYGLAAHLMLEENEDTASFFNGRYEELKRLASKQPPSAMEQIVNVYGGFG